MASLATVNTDVQVERPRIRFSADPKTSVSCFCCNRIGPTDKRVVYLNEKNEACEIPAKKAPPADQTLERIQKIISQAISDLQLSDDYVYSYLSQETNVSWRTVTISSISKGDLQSLDDALERLYALPKSMSTGV